MTSAELEPARPTSTRAAPLLVAMIGTALVAGYVAAPARGAAETMAVAAPAVAALAILVGVAVHRPLRPVSWWLVALGCAIQAVSVGARGAEAFRGDLDGPGVAEAIALLSYPALFAGVLAITSIRPLPVLDGPISTVVVLASTALVWMLVVDHEITSGELPLGNGDWVGVLALLDAVLAALVVRRLLRAPVRNWSLWLLAAAFVVWGNAHGFVGTDLYNDTFEPGSITAASLMVGPLMIGVAALLPSMAAPVRTRRSEHEEADTLAGDTTWRAIRQLTRWALIPLAALATVLAVIEDERPTEIAVAIASVAVVALTIARTQGMVGGLRADLDAATDEEIATMLLPLADLVVVTDRTGRVTHVEAVRPHRFSSDEWLGRELGEIIGDADRAATDERLERLRAAPIGTCEEFEAMVVGADLRQRLVSFSITKESTGEDTERLFVRLRDDTEQYEIQHHLSRRAHLDTLTGLGNRALFLDRLDHALSITRTDADPVSVLFIDLDDLKRLNDTLGHDAGDQALVEVARRIQALCGDGDTAARIGGDEFAVLLEDVGGSGRAVELAEQLVSEVRQPFQTAAGTGAVTASIGVAMAGSVAEPTELLRHADVAMYEAKRSGKDRVRVFRVGSAVGSPASGPARSPATADAVPRLEFAPIVELATGHVVGADAVVTGERSDGTDRWLVRTVLDHAAAWPTHHRVSQRPLTWGLPCSVRGARRRGWSDEVIQAVDGSGVAPSLVLVELDEALLDELDATVLTNLRELRDHGIRVAVVGYGAGACSLHPLLRAPLDAVRLDAELVHELGAGGPRAPLVHALLATAGAVGLETMADGLDTVTVVRRLRDAGCGLGQGPVLSPTLDAGSITRRLGSPRQPAVAAPA